MLTILARLSLRQKILVLACLILLLAPIALSGTVGATAANAPRSINIELVGKHKCSKGSFFGLEPWYAYLDYGWDSVTKSCQINNFKFLGSNSDIPLILLAVVNDLLRIAGLVAVAFVIMGGVKYITSQGNPDSMAAAQKTIIDALIGLLIALMAVAIVTFLGKTLS